MTRYLVTIGLGCLVAAGCMRSVAEPPAEKQQPPPEKKQSILKKTTQDIGEYDPAAGLEIVEADVEITNPITGPLEAYGPTVQRVAGISVDYMLTMFNAEHGRYPTYDEFMEQIIKNKQAPVRLPVLPGGLKYQYDEDNHKLVVVRPPEAAPAE